MITDIITLIGVPLMRGVAGWAENSFADGKVSLLEYKKLAETVLKLGVPGVALCYGFAMPIEFAVSIPLVVDYAFSYYQKAFKKVNK